jgi:hypothetical protein
LSQKHCIKIETIFYFDLSSYLSSWFVAEARREVKGAYSKFVTGNGKGIEVYIRAKEKCMMS